jgi:hypothetical protein
MTTSRLKFFGLLAAGVFMALLFTLAPSGKTAQAQACDPSGSRDGTAVPNVVPPNTPVAFTATNFSAGEEVSFWFTLPDGNVFGTAAPLCCADDSGTVRFEPLVLPEGFYQFPGRWAMTVQGASSSHASVIYFCVVTAVQPTQPPATNTPVPVPATNTPEATATISVPPTVEATATTAIIPTVEVSPTAAVATPTVEVATPTVEVATPTVAVVPTTPPVIPPPVVVPTAVVTPITPGMPTTGGAANGPGDALLYVTVALVALNLIVLGYFARRRAAARR